MTTQYDELVKRLKIEADLPCTENRDLFRKSADAIEELQAKLAILWDAYIQLQYGKTNTGSLYILERNINNELYT